MNEVDSEKGCDCSKGERITVSVRDIVEFVHRKGGLGGTGGFVSHARAREGADGHREVQRRRGSEYEAEMVVSNSWVINGIELKVQGRIDGVLKRGDDTIVEEIKTVKRGWDGSPRDLHWAQTKFYGALLCSERGLNSVVLQLTYLELSDDHLVEFHQSFSTQELKKFVDDTVKVYVDWMMDLRDWRLVRDKSLAELNFPFRNYRRGQRGMAVAVYRHMRDGQQLLVEAATGIGKTMSVLYPSLKVMGEGLLDRIFYLTSRTLGRGVAEDTLVVLRAAGLRLRSVTLTAKEKLCFKPEGESGCDLRTCPFSIGYYDKVKGALRELLLLESITRSNIEAIARSHVVCPFELSLDAATWSDVVIGDFNHAFDPRARLKRFFDDKVTESYGLLVDEAHHLPDRGREMFSAELSRADCRALKKAVGSKASEIRRAMEKVLKMINGMKKVLPTAQYKKGRMVVDSKTRELAVDDPDEDLLKQLKLFVGSAERWLLKEEDAAFTEDVRTMYYVVSRFVQVWEEVDERFVFIIRRAGRDIVFKWFCKDPSVGLRQILEKCHASIFFSATLTPLEYYVSLSGCASDTSVVEIGSPFPPENLDVSINT
ncbi:hypothetical protein N9B94_03700, partial [Verrucomicrobia bacterium]|nr:hypothetical protein [Verrucomicrobiota bacterium]